MEKTDYVWQGGTWWFIEGECEECGARVASNGTIHDCVSCDWWETIE